MATQQLRLSPHTWLPLVVRKTLATKISDWIEVPLTSPRFKRWAMHQRQPDGRHRLWLWWLSSLDTTACYFPVILHLHPVPVGSGPTFFGKRFLRHINACTRGSISAQLLPLFVRSRHSLRHSSMEQVYTCASLSHYQHRSVRSEYTA